MKLFWSEIVTLSPGKEATNFKKAAANAEVIIQYSTMRRRLWKETHSTIEKAIPNWSYEEAIADLGQKIC